VKGKKKEEMASGFQVCQAVCEEDGKRFFGFKGWGRGDAFKVGRSWRNGGKRGAGLRPFFVKRKTRELKTQVGKSRQRNCTKKERGGRGKKNSQRECAG